MAVLLTGEWHVVELMAAGRNMTMRVDGGAARTIINDGDQHQFSELSEQPLYLGGLPASRRTAAKKKYHVRNTDSFNGTLAVALCLSVRLSLTSWYSIWTDRACFWHGGFLRPVLKHCVERKLGISKNKVVSLQNFVPNSGLQSVVLWTKLVDGRAC